jgi:hypothetical protein
MKKYEVIIDEVKQGVTNALEEMLRKGGTTINYEKQVGEAYINVELLWDDADIFMQYDYEVVVSHADCSKKSPLLESAIYDALPDFENIYFKYNER